MRTIAQVLAFIALRDHDRYEPLARPEAPTGLRWELLEAAAHRVLPARHRLRSVSGPGLAPEARARVGPALTERPVSGTHTREPTVTHFLHDHPRLALALRRAAEYAPRRVVRGKDAPIRDL